MSLCDALIPPTILCPSRTTRLHEIDTGTRSGSRVPPSSEAVATRAPFKRNFGVGEQRARTYLSVWGESAKETYSEDSAPDRRVVQQVVIGIGVGCTSK